MGRRAGAAVLFCVPLLAGCGTATRLDFRGHSRPASPTDVSVYIGAAGIEVDPRRLSPGPVEFYVTNQTGRAVSIAVMRRDGRTVIRGPSIAAGGTAQLKTTLTRHAYGVGLAGRPSSMKLLELEGRSGTGNDDLLQP